MLYVDVDAFCKLAHWNILPLLPELTRHQWHEIATVSSLWHRANRAKTRPDGKLFYAVEPANIACSCMEKMGRLPEPKPEKLMCAIDVPQIDPGEAVLLSITADDPTGYFLTGDKRALKALSRLDCVTPLIGRILTVEQILFLCIEKMGHTWFMKNVCPYRHIDKAVYMITGSQCLGTETSVKAGLFSYINEISALCDPSLIYTTNAFGSQ